MHPFFIHTCSIQQKQLYGIIQYKFCKQKLHSQAFTPYKNNPLQLQ